MVGLALEGGGAKGSYEIGSYVALKEMGIKFDMVVGTSIGSLNAALIAQGDINLAKNLYFSASSEMIGIDNALVESFKDKKLSKKEIKDNIKILKKIIDNKGLDVNKYKQIIDENLDEDKVRNSKINYGLVTVRTKDLKTLELTIKDIEKGKLSEYIVASSYLPVFKMNKIIDDSYYLDGGFANNLPIDMLKHYGCDKIYAIRINGVGFNKLFYKADYEISPTKDTGPIILFDNKDIVNNYYMGYYDTLLYFNKLDGYIYYFKKFKYYNFITRNIDKKLIDLLKVKFLKKDIKDIVLKSIEEILNHNKIDYYKVYKIPKIIKYIKKNNLKCNDIFVNDFVYNLKYFY